MQLIYILLDLGSTTMYFHKVFSWIEVVPGTPESGLL